jgi:hypothetical protein
VERALEQAWGGAVGGQGCKVRCRTTDVGAVGAIARAVICRSAPACGRQLSTGFRQSRVGQLSCGDRDRAVGWRRPDADELDLDHRLGAQNGAISISCACKPRMQRLSSGTLIPAGSCR